MTPPKITQIVAVHISHDEGCVIYGLASDGSVWMAEPNRWKAETWEGPVVSTPNAETAPQ